MTSDGGRKQRPRFRESDVAAKLGREQCGPQDC